MEKYFANYNQSLALKELGFDEPCLSEFWKRDDGELFPISGNELFEYVKSNTEDYQFILYLNDDRPQNDSIKLVKATSKKFKFTYTPPPKNKENNKLLSNNINK